MESNLAPPPDSALSRHQSLAITVGVQVALQVIGIVTGAVVSRLLGVDGRGLMALAFAWSAAITYLGDLGGPVAYTFFAARKVYGLRELQANSYLLSLVQSVLLAVIGWPLVMIVLRSQPGAVHLTQWFLLAFLPTNLLQRYLLALLQGTSRFLSYGVAVVSVQVTYGLTAVLLFVLSRPSVPLVLASIIAGNVVAVAIAFKALGRPAGLTLPNAKLLRETFAYGLRAHLGNIAPIERLQVDLLVVAAVLGTFSAGLYVVAASVASLPRFLGFAIGMVALPHVAQGPTGRDRVEAAGAMFRLATILILAIAIPLEVTARLLVPLIYGEHFVASIPLAQVLIVGAAAASLRRTLGDSFRGLGQPLLATYSEVAGWTVAIAGFLLLMPRLGAMGAAESVTLSFVVALVASVVLALSVGGLSVSQLGRFRTDDFRAAYAVAIDLARVVHVTRWRPYRTTPEARLK